jgi:hypothetical protein
MGKIEQFEDLDILVLRRQSSVDRTSEGSLGYLRQLPHDQAGIASGLLVRP